MKSFTPREEKILQIFAVNRPDRRMRTFFGRSLLPFLGNEARLAGLILLERDEEEIAQVSACFSAEDVVEVNIRCERLMTEARVALEDLERRLSRSSHILSA